MRFYMKKISKLLAFAALASMFMGTAFISCSSDSDDPVAPAPAGGDEDEKTDPAEELTSYTLDLTKTLEKIPYTVESGKNKVNATTEVTMMDDVFGYYSKGVGNLILRENGSINYGGESLAANAFAEDGTVTAAPSRYVGVDLSKFKEGSYKVTFNFETVLGGAAQDVGFACCYVAPSLENLVGKVTAKKENLVIAKGDGKSGTAETLECTINTAENKVVELLFCRNGQNGGGIDVTGVTVTAAE